MKEETETECSRKVIKTVQRKRMRVRVMEEETEKTEY